MCSVPSASKEMIISNCVLYFRRKGNEQTHIAAVRCSLGPLLAIRRKPIPIASCENCIVTAYVYLEFPEQIHILCILYTE